MADGRVIRTGTRAKKSSAGYDLTRLLIGSEGTLGLITELTVTLHGIPEAIAGGICSFPSVKAACNAVITTIQYGIPVARIELLGACADCSMINMTLKGGVESALKKAAPELTAIEAINLQ